MSEPQSRLNFDQPAYFDEIVGRNLEQVHGSYCVAQHECEQQQSRACHEVVRALGHHGVAGAEEGRMLEVDLAAGGCDPSRRRSCACNRRGRYHALAKERTMLLRKVLSRPVSVGSKCENLAMAYVGRSTPDRWGN